MYLFCPYLLQHLPVPYTAPLRARTRTRARARLCVCVRVCMRTGVCVCMWVWACAYVWVWVYGWVLPKGNGVTDYNYNQALRVAYV